MKSLLLCLTLMLAGCSIPLPPEPQPQPVIPVSGLRVLIVRETAETSTLLPSQNVIFTSAPFRKFIRDANGKLKVWDDEVDTAHESDVEFRKLLELPRASLPWIVIADGSKTISQPLPKTIEETQALIAGAK